jgi:predicted amidohydrolase YtcJ
MTAPVPSAPTGDPRDEVLYTGVVVYSTQDPEASALLVADGIVAWIGPAETAETLHPRARRVDATGCLLTPGFVDCLPTADGSEVDAAWRERALARGITAAVPGPVGTRDGMRVLSPVAEELPLKDLSAEGVPLAFGSAGREDAADPWSWVRAAAHSGEPAQRISDRAAFLASTRAGLRLLDIPHPGALNLGVEATLVIWEPWDFTVHSSDIRTNAWSVDPRSRTPMLPDLTDGAPRALRTLIRGEVVHDTPGALAR